MDVRKQIWCSSQRHGNFEFPARVPPGNPVRCAQSRKRMVRKSEHGSTVQAEGRRSKGWKEKLRLRPPPVPWQELSAYLKECEDSWVGINIWIWECVYYACIYRIYIYIYRYTNPNCDILVVIPYARPHSPQELVSWNKAVRPQKTLDTNSTQRRSAPTILRKRICLKSGTASNGHDINRVHRLRNLTSNYISARQRQRGNIAKWICSEPPQNYLHTEATAASGQDNPNIT